jgi:carbon storage regulator
MLILTRRIDEKIVIDNNIVISVLAVEGDKVKIGIDAPKEISVLRQELWEAIQEQNQIAEKLASGSEPTEFEALRNLLASEQDPESQAENDQPDSPTEP